MKSFGAFALLSLASLAAAQTPLDFPLVSTTRLDVVYAQAQLNITLAPGALVRGSDTATQPDVYKPADDDENLFVVIMIDQDVLRNSSRVELLHWLQPNMKAASNGNLSMDVTADGASSAVGASYIGPRPPQGDIPHRYTFLLFAQPSGWTIPTNYSTINPPADTSARIGFNLVDFVGASGLGEPLAGAYMRVLNGTAQATADASQATGDAAPAATATASSGGASGTSSGASSSATGNAASGIMEPVNHAREMVLGLTLAMVGAGAWML